MKNNYCEFQNTMLIAHIHNLEKTLKEVTLKKERQERELQMAMSMNAQSQPVNFFQIITLELFKIENIYNILFLFEVSFSAIPNARFHFKL